LHVETEEVDALQFERLLEASETLEPSERAAALREGLAFWRGAPLADLAFESFAQPEIARLDELRLVAHERRFEAELELGRHDAVLGELEALAARHPTREHLRALQMLSFYRAGRQRDALRVYAETRRELVEQYGLEPGEELRGLERRILSQDPTLRPPARPPRPRAEGLRRNAVVLLTEILGPEDRESTGSFLAEVGTIVERHDGEVRSLAPEEVLAVFGPPRAHDDDTLRALRAADAVRAAAPPGLAMRTAIERLVGAGAGSPDLAALRQLLGKARSGDLLLGPEALRLVPRAVDVVPHEAGGGYRVLRFDPEAEPFLRHLEVPLIGRTAELDRLAHALAEVVQTGSPGRLVLVGDAGIGKTRLAREFVTRHGAEVTTLTARCRGDSDRAAALPMLDILRQLGPLEPLLAGEADAEKILAPLDERALSQPSEASWAFRRLLEVSAGERPLVLLLEDVHLAAPAFLDLIEYVTGWTSSPVLVLCVGRPELLEARPDWRDGAVFLGAMSAAEARQLVEALPSAAKLDNRTVAATVTAAEGNPLFVEQLVAFAAEDPSGLLPPTLEALIASRVDRLPYDERQVVEWASVAGRHFWRSTVEAIAPAEARADVGAALMALVRRRLVQPERALLTGEDGFRFHHALIREVVYEGLPQRARADAHQTVARVVDDRDGAFDEIVAYHLERAALLRAQSGDPDRRLAEEASTRLGGSGIAALNRVDAWAAVDLLTRAIALVNGEGERTLELECMLGIAFKFGGDSLRAQALLEDVARRSVAVGNERIEHLARVEQVWQRLAAGELSVAESRALVDRAIEIFERADDAFALGRAWHTAAVVIGVYEFRYGELDEMAARTRVHYARTGFAPAVPLFHRALAGYRGPMNAAEAADRCRLFLTQAGTPVWESFLLPLLAALEAMQGRFGHARVLLEEARVGRQEFADPGTLATSWAAIAAEVELLAQSPRRAEAILADACTALRAAGDVEWLATNTAILAEAQYLQGRHEEALSMSEFALEIGPPEHLTSKAVARRVRAKALARVGRGPEAEAAAAEAIALLEGTDVLNELGETFVAAAEVHALAGQPANAHADWERALAYFEQKGNVVSAARVREAAAPVS
jgi:tetratricopeptide (TPR) repeat protein